jgi:hypothetical protein
MQAIASNSKIPDGTVWLVQVDPPFVVASITPGNELFPGDPAA